MRLFLTRSTQIGRRNNSGSRGVKQHEDHVNSPSPKVGLNSVLSRELVGKSHTPEPGAALQVVGRSIAEVVAQGATEAAEYVGRINSLGSRGLESPVFARLLPLHRDRTSVAGIGHRRPKFRHSRGGLQFKDLRMPPLPAAGASFKMEQNRRKVLALPPGLQAPSLDAKLEVHTRVNAPKPGLRTAPDGDQGLAP